MMIGRSSGFLFLASWVGHLVRADAPMWVLHIYLSIVDVN